MKHARPFLDGTGARVLDRLDNSHGSTKHSAEALLKVLDEETLTKLAELLTAQQQKGKPAK